MDLSELIRTTRKNKNISQKDFADSLGLSAIHYNAIENKRRNVTIDLLEKVALVTDTMLIVTFIDKPKDKQKNKSKNKRK